MKFDLVYYLELQRRLKEVNHFISFHKDNFNTYSQKIENLFQDSCIFFNSICLTFIKDASLSKHKFNNEIMVDHFDKKVSGDENFTLENYKDLLEEDYGLSVKKLILNLYEENFFKAYLTEKYYNPIEKLGTKRKSEFKIQPFSNWRLNKPLHWYQDYKKLKETRLPNKNKATLINTLNAMAAIYVILSLKYREDFLNGIIVKEIYDVFTPLYGHHDTFDNRNRKTKKFLNTSVLH